MVDDDILATSKENLTNRLSDILPLNVTVSAPSATAELYSHHTTPQTELESFTASLATGR